VLFGAAFPEPETWAAWRTFLAACFALPMVGDELALYSRRTGRQTPPKIPVREAWLVVGRRGGKSRIAALVAVYVAAFRDYRTVLAPGEKATVAVIAADRQQARVCFRYITGLFDAVPMLQRLVVRRTANALELSNHVAIEVHTCSYRTTRGYSFAAVIADEVAFWRSEESANPDVEILAGIRPGLATIPGALLLCISTPYARRGALWDTYRRHYGHDGDPVLVWRAATRDMNPTVDPAVIAAAYEQDDAAAAAEYGAEFRRDIEAFLDREAVGAVVVPGQRERAAVPGTTYVAFVDPSGGSGDSMTLAIAHRVEDHAVLDAVREVRPPFSPDAVVEEFAQLLRQYRIGGVVGDRYAGEWPRERFRAHGISYIPAKSTKAELYATLLAAINSRRVELLDLPRLVTQLCGLERRTAWGGRETIDHSPGGHDDVANAVAGALTLAAKPPWRPAEVRATIISIPVHRQPWFGAFDE
jgi:hypothetical protein